MPRRVAPTPEGLAFLPAADTAAVPAGDVAVTLAAADAGRVGAIHLRCAHRGRLARHI